MTYLGAIQRGGRVVVELADKTYQPRSETLGEAVEEFIKGNVVTGQSQLLTDGFKGYDRLNDEMPHHVVTDKREIVDDVQIHTNQMEGFWAGIKRAFYGTYHHYTRKYAPLYIAESTCKYNHRGDPDIFENFIQRILPIQV